MYISNSPGASQVSTQVWLNAVRKITGLGTALASSGTINTALANGSSVNFQPSAGSAQFVHVLGQAAANVTWQLTMTNGVTFEPLLTGASGAGIQMLTIVGNGFFANLANTGTVSGNYSDVSIGFLS